MEETNSNIKEINLLELLRLIGKQIHLFFKLVLNGIGKSLQLLYRHKVLFLIILIIGICTGFYYSSKPKRIYKAQGMVRLYGVKSHTVSKLGEQLTADVYNKKKLTERLMLDREVIESIEAIEFFPVIDYNKDSIPNTVDLDRKHPLTDTVNVIMNNYVFLQFKLRGGFVHAREVGNSIINYINRQSFVQNKYLSYKENLTERLNLCNVELKRLDSLSNETYFNDKPKQVQYTRNRLLVGDQHTQLFYEDQLILHKVKSQINTELLGMSTPLVVPSGFVVNPYPINGRLRMITRFSLLALIVSILVSYILENRRKWNNYLKGGKE